MSKTIKIKNPQLPQSENTYLTAKYTSGTSLTVKNNEGWANNDIVVVGLPGQERAEAGDVAGTSGDTTITIDAALKYDHPANTPLYRSEFDQISLERKPSAGSFAEIAEGKKDIEWDESDGFTKIKVAAGLDTDTYRWRFYNSLANEYSSYSGELAGTGLTQFQAGYIIAKLRKFGKIPAQLGMTDLDLLDILNEGQRDVDTRAPGGRWWFALTEDDSSSRIQATAGTYKYDLPSDFRAMDVVKVLDQDSLLYNLNFIPRIEFDAYIQDQSTGNRSDSTRNWTILAPDSDNTIGYFGVNPIPESTTNYFYRRYWRYLPTLTSFASSTLMPLPETLFNYGMYKVYRLREDKENANTYLGYYFENIKQMIKMESRQVGQLEFARFRGQKGFARLFGNIVNYSDTQRENNW